jgi:hypothetical protein
MRSGDSDAVLSAFRRLCRTEQTRIANLPRSHLERKRYSVLASFTNRPVSLRVYPQRIVVVSEGQVLCEHKQLIDRSHDRQGRTVYDWRHYLAVIQRKPGALRNEKPFADLPEAFKQLQQHLLKHPGGTGKWWGVMSNWIPVDLTTPRGPSCNRWRPHRASFQPMSISACELLPSVSLEIAHLCTRGGRALYSLMSSSPPPPHGASTQGNCLE